MSGKLISNDKISTKYMDFGVTNDKDKGLTIDYQMAPDTKISANSKTGLSVNK